MAGRTFALLDDRLNCRTRCLKIRDGDQLVEASDSGGNLRIGLSDEQLRFSELTGEPPEAVLDRAVEVADGKEILCRGDQDIGPRRTLVRPPRPEPSAGGENDARSEERRVGEGG